MAKNREHKSDAFSMLMENKRYALDVYNALNQSKYTDPESIQVERLEGAISLSMRNDASFIIDGRLNMYEHQSTYNPNMPLRSMVYYANIMEKWIKKNKCDLYGSKRIKIPVPYFVVFYNGLEPRPEQEEMRLSEAFLHETANPQLELVCKVYNINSGYNENLKEISEVLRGYTYFVEKVREYQRDKSVSAEESIDKAIEDCIVHHILEDFFKERKDEIRKMTTLDFTWEVREELVKRDAREEGIEKGIEKGVRDSLQNLMKNLGLSKEEAMDALGIEGKERERYRED